MGNQESILGNRKLIYNLPSNSKFLVILQGCIAKFGPQIHIAKASGRKLIQTHIDAALDVLWSESGKTNSFFSAKWPSKYSDVF